MREVVEIQTDAAAQDGVSGWAETVGDSQARREGFAVIVRDARDNTIAGEGGIRPLVAAGSDEQTESGVVAQAVVDCQMRNDTPGVLCVNSQAPHAF